MKLGAALKADWAPKENGEAEDDAAEGAPNPDGGNEPNGVVAGAPKGATVDFDAMSPNAGVEDDGLAAPKVNEAVVVFVALAPKEPKLGAAAVEGVVC